MRALLAACAVLAVVAPAVHAHTTIKTTSPRNGTTVPRSLSAVTVTFKAGIVSGTLVVRNAKGRKVSAGKGRLTSRDRVLRARLRSRPRPGVYRARVKWLSSDGHIAKRTLRFRVR